MLKKRPPSPYAVGSTPGIADIGIAGHLVSAQLFKIDLAAYPTVKALGETYFANAAFMDSHPLRQPGAPQI
jgi:maleylpyruvate isomerase